MLARASSGARVALCFDGTCGAKRGAARALWVWGERFSGTVEVGDFVGQGWPGSLFL